MSRKVLAAIMIVLLAGCGEPDAEDPEVDTRLDETGECLYRLCYGPINDTVVTAYAEERFSQVLPLRAEYGMFGKAGDGFVALSVNQEKRFSDDLEYLEDRVFWLDTETQLARYLHTSGRGGLNFVILPDGALFEHFPREPYEPFTRWYSHNDTFQKLQFHAVETPAIGHGKQGPWVLLTEWTNRTHHAWAWNLDSGEEKQIWPLEDSLPSQKFGAGDVYGDRAFFVTQDDEAGGIWYPAKLELWELNLTTMERFLRFEYRAAGASWLVADDGAVAWSASPTASYKRVYWWNIDQHNTPQEQTAGLGNAPHVAGNWLVFGGTSDESNDIIMHHRETGERHTLAEFEGPRMLRLGGSTSQYYWTTGLEDTDGELAYFLFQTDLDAFAQKMREQA